MHQEALGWTNTKLLESFLVSHRQHNSFNQLFNLLVESTDVGVLFNWSLVDFHGFDAGIILGWQLFIDDETLFVARDQLTWLQVFSLDHAEDWQVDSVSASCLDYKRFLRRHLLLCLLDCEA